MNKIFLPKTRFNAIMLYHTIKLSIVADSGTGELLKISGTGNYQANQTGLTWELEVDI